MLMTAYQTLLAENESPSDSDIIKKTKEMFPHLDATSANLKHRAMRVRKNHPALTVATSVPLESCIGRKDCSNESAVKEFIQRFPNSRHGDEVIVDALVRMPECCRYVLGF